MEPNSVPSQWHPITRADLDWFRALTYEVDWRPAVTYAERAPHEYLVEQGSSLSAGDFVRMARVIHTFGQPQKFYRWTRIYLEIDGWKYWTMDADHRDVRLVNRCRAWHVYGVQNAPRTVSGVESPYDAIATYWGAGVGYDPGEAEAVATAVREHCGDTTRMRVLDVGAGTGFAFAMGLADPRRSGVVDPSQAMLNELVRRHPTVARVEPMTLEEARRRRVFGGTRFDLVLALGGAATYFTSEDWAALESLSRGRFALTVFAEGVEPVTRDLSRERLVTARDLLHEFAQPRTVPVQRVGRWELMVSSD